MVGLLVAAIGDGSAFKRGHLEKPSPNRLSFDSLS